MLTRDPLQRAATETGFPIDSLEKVSMLVRLLNLMAVRPFLGPRVALKGGTAPRAAVPHKPERRRSSAWCCSRPISRRPSSSWTPVSSFRPPQRRGRDRGITRLRRPHGRLAEVEDALFALEDAEIETKWVVKALADFDTVWDVLRTENQARLVRALVQRVEVDEPRGAVTAHLVDLAGGGAARLNRRRAGKPMNDVAAEPTMVFGGQLFRTRKGRAWTFTEEPPPPAPEPVRRPARVAKTLAMAHAFEAAITRGELRDRADLARRLDLNRARVTQILDLVLLAPDIQEAVLHLEAVDGVEPAAERALRDVVRRESWSEQRVAWAELAVGA